MDISDQYELKSSVVVGASEASKNGRFVGSGRFQVGRTRYENNCVYSVRNDDDSV